MNLSQKYTNIEAEIAHELSDLKPDFERLFYLCSQQKKMLKQSLDLLKKERFRVSAIKKRMRTANRKSRPQTQ